MERLSGGYGNKQASKTSGGPWGICKVQMERNDKAKARKGRRAEKGRRDLAQGCQSQHIKNTEHLAFCFLQPSYARGAVRQWKRIAVAVAFTVMDSRVTKY